jgi:transcriptional regulator with XRE-family HTH domain
MQRAAKPIDVQVGACVRTHRRLLGMTQSDLGVALGVSFQQVQKYEKGTNRIGAGRLHDIANALRVPVSAFFEKPIDDSTPIDNTTRDASEHTRCPDSERTDLILSNEGLALARSFARIGDAKVRRRVVRLVEELSKLANDFRADAIVFDDAAVIREGRPDSGRA